MKLIEDSERMFDHFMDTRRYRTKTQIVNISVLAL